ncbi:Zn-dependent exopeptidase [Terfezia boudieri ATCC MYA-4762]|uniref:Peptide hydrolase n=1 Tax=Terfezia boudieri ATCC MYA-4762 TaxID=1051890 RepID=A0A3N4LEP0_9PEZI|nr:Zn-dependent exopeptidase [Terfezia boudieri ATCC MYA-4762]
MQLQQLVFSLLSVASVARALTVLTTPTPSADRLPLAQSDKLRRVLTRKALLKHANKFLKFSQTDPDGNRGFGGVGHNLTANYLYNTFSTGDMADYYTVEKQMFIHEYAYGTTKVIIEGQTHESSYFTYSPSTDGELKLPLGLAANLGCTPEDYPDLTGKIALISRGTCEFGLKSVLAGKAGAQGILIYNNVPGIANGGTYGSPVRELGPYVPGAMISQADGLTLVADLKAGPVTATFNVEALSENRTTFNVIAQTKGGDQKNVVALGGHTDSVGAGPGINDNGSGTIGILEVAKALTKYSVNNAVRFCFWSAEEFGLVGSAKYVESLPTKELDKIALYLNFDMIASPNYVYFVYDGDGSASNLTGPAGSDKIKHMFEEHFLNVGWKVKPTAFNGRSDYGPFIEVGIPSGGLFTGAEGVKTAEEAAYYGGKAGAWYDPNYHRAGDNVKNCDLNAWITNTKAIAHSVATYACSTESIPKRAPAKAKREFRPKAKSHMHHSHCGHEDLLE